MQILLINPFMDHNVVEEIFSFETELPPLGLLYIASSLEQQGHRVEIIDFGMEKYSDRKISKEIKNIDAIGITVRTHGLQSVIKITNQIKKQNPDLPIIIGGPHCTLDPLQSLKDIKADICVKGEGEEAIKLITKALQGKIKLENIPGIYYRKNNQIKKGLPQKIIENLDEIPFPARHLIEKYRYGVGESQLTISKGNTASMVISRGCPYNCKFCIVQSIYSGYRTRSVENTIEEIKKINEKYETLFIMDDNFLADIRSTNELLDAIIKEKINLEIGIAGVRVDSANKTIFKKMRKAGIKTIAFGIESGNQDILDFYNKKIKLDQIKKAVKLANSMRFLTSGSFIVGAPLETEKHLENTLNFSKELRLDIAVFSPLCYMIGSPLWKEAVDSGLIKKNQYNVVSDKSKGLGNFSEDELIDWCLKSLKKYYLRPSYIINQVFYSLIKGDLRLIREGIKLLSRKDNVLHVTQRNGKI